MRRGASMELNGREVAKTEMEKYPDLREPLSAWMTLIEATIWNNVQELKATFSKVKYVREMHGFVFNIKGNKYRLLASIDFIDHVVTILKVGKHEEYDYW
jgi:mRNA interferase HigB